MVATIVLAGPAALALAGPETSTAAGTPLAQADAQTAPDEATATLIAQTYGHSVVVASSLTPTTEVTAQPDGSQQLTISSEPVRIQQNGDWVDVDTTLGQASDGMLAPNAPVTPVRFSPGGDGPLAKIQAPDGSWVTVDPPFSPLPTAVQDGDSAIYPDIIPGVDLQLTATESGMSEVLIINSAEAAADPRLSDLAFPVSGATVTEGTATDSATATTPAGTTVVSPTPTWWDSADGGSADGPGGAGLTQPVEADITSTGLTVDAAVPANTPTATYPVYIDPDWTGGVQAWTFVDSRYPSSSYWLGSNHGSDNQAHVGYIDSAHCGCTDGAHLDRTYWQMDTSAIAGKHVLAAHFDTQEIYSDACTTNTFQLNVVGAFNSSTTWNNQPAFAYTVSKADLGPQRSNCPNQNGAGWDAFAAANDAATHNYSNISLEVQADNEGDWTTWRRFTSNASLTITYNTAPNTPYNPSVNNAGCATSAPGTILRNTAAAQAVLRITDSDPDGQNVGVKFAVGVAPNTSYSVTRGQVSSAQLDTGLRAAGDFQFALPSNLAETTYVWSSYSYDGTDRSPTNSQQCYFTIKNSYPFTPVITSGTTGTIAVGSRVTVNLAQRYSTDRTVQFAWTWQPSVTAPTVEQLPPCGQESPLGGIHFVCGSSATLTVAPELAPAAQFSVWAFDAAGNRSPRAYINFSTVDADPNQLYTVTHQWTTDQGGPVTPASCPYLCIPDTNGVTSAAPRGQAPVRVGPWATFDSNGDSVSGFAGELNFRDLSQSSNNTNNDYAAYTPNASGFYFDWDRSFTVAAMLTPGALTGQDGPDVALSQWGNTYATIRLQVNSQQHYELCVHSRTNAALGACATSPSVVTLHQSTFVAGVYDSINGELRLYLNGTLASVTNFVADGSGDNNLIFLGCAKSNDAVIDRWVGQIANPMIAQAVFSPTQISQLRNESFFPTAG